MARLSTDHKQNLTTSGTHQDQELRITNYEWVMGNG